ncbi:hypothetical protein ASPVEDRAFT_46732 [Aspergillus versicolor CBS 583.65]|uniref:Ricin B lectin n=1 Tax=Aspergillus versicolor CBS 583.65 TaxID=1036611 RepID=A0A1L9Q0V4_ASPVE|nr:uncharacterized protein ASPVEDRAFT_46732 [Aspergillus versicolor CBS 583.65]OJJ07405.1 hypothetical protein ASPVEDRAFT_46732 [Aspergillus versicolor CBS 583.65]
MRLSIITVALATASTASAALTWTLEKSSSPTDDEADAYGLIEAAMEAAVARHASLGDASKSINVYYVPGVPTAEASYDGTIRFGTDRNYLNERTALHEISHTLGIGQTAAFDEHCAANDWPTATPLLQSWDGADAVINCGGGHIWPYGLNYNDEWSETNADRHVELINAMLADGL